jgi:CheY-like chemotaxis protein
MHPADRKFFILSGDSTFQGDDFRMVRVLIVDDHAVVRRVENVLNLDQEVETGQATNGEEAAPLTRQSKLM